MEWHQSEITDVWPTKGVKSLSTLKYCQMMGKSWERCSLPEGSHITHDPTSQQWFTPKTLSNSMKNFQSTNMELTLESQSPKCNYNLLLCSQNAEFHLIFVIRIW